MIIYVDVADPEDVRRAIVKLIDELRDSMMTVNLLSAARDHREIGCSWLRPPTDGDPGTRGVYGRIEDTIGALIAEPSGLNLGARMAEEIIDEMIDSGEYFNHVYHRLLENDHDLALYMEDERIEEVRYAEAEAAGIDMSSLGGHDAAMGVLDRRFSKYAAGFSWCITDHASIAPVTADIQAFYDVIR